jgi:hypothetical protein
MAFTIDRVEAARRLGVSTRTIDRHIQWDRIRTKRIGKKIFLDDGDVETIRQMEPARKEEDYIVIYDEPARAEKSVALPVDPRQMVNYSELYRDAQAAIVKKDEIIQDLSYRLGKTETELKNSIPAIDYKQATFLLESAKSKSVDDVESLTKKITHLEKEVEKRNSGIIGLSVIVILILAFSLILFLYTRGWSLL